MATITVTEFKGTKSIQLNPAQADMFDAEVRRVVGGWLMQLLARLTSPKVRKYATAPDCLVTVNNGGRVTEYEIYGGYFLRRVGDVTMHTFYMGLLLLHWLYK